MIVLIAMVALVIDGGYAWGQQRETQNGGGLRREGGGGRRPANLAGGIRDGGEVGCAVENAADDNEVELETAVYTNLRARPMTRSGGTCGPVGHPSRCAGREG